jgi:hypothetical protein
MKEEDYMMFGGATGPFFNISGSGKIIKNEVLKIEVFCGLCR